MKITLTLFLMLLLAFASAAATQNANQSANGNANTGSATNSNRRPRGPVFRANREQINQAQAILTQRGFYSGDQTGRLTPETRAALRRYQEAERLRVTGTLNRATLEKMNITLTERQRSIQ